MELIVFIRIFDCMVRFYISELTCFAFFSPDLCCVPRLYIALFSVAIVALGFGGAIGKWGAKTVGLGGAKMYCDLVVYFF